MRSANLRCVPRPVDAGWFTTATSVDEVSAPEPDRNDWRARDSLTPESKSKLTPDLPRHQAERHCWNVRASTGAPSATKEKLRTGQFCGVGANDSGTTMRSPQLHAWPRLVSNA